MEFGLLKEQNESKKDRMFPLPKYSRFGPNGAFVKSGPSGMQNVIKIATWLESGNSMYLMVSETVGQIREKRLTLDGANKQITRRSQKSSTHVDRGFSVAVHAESGAWHLRMRIPLPFGRPL